MQPSHNNSRVHSTTINDQRISIWNSQDKAMFGISSWSRRILLEAGTEGLCAAIPCKDTLTYL